MQPVTEPYLAPTQHTLQGACDAFQVFVKRKGAITDFLLHPGHGIITGSTLSFVWSEHATIRQLRTRIASSKWVLCGHELLANHPLSRQQGNNQALETDVQASTLQASVVNGHTGRPKVCRPSTIHRHWRKDFRREVSPGHGRGLKRAVATAQAEDSLRAPGRPILRSEKLLFRGKTKVHELHCSGSCFHDVVDLTPHHESRFYGFLVRVCTATGPNVSVTTPPECTNWIACRSWSACRRADLLPSWIGNRSGITNRSGVRRHSCTTLHVKQVAKRSNWQEGKN